MHGTCGNWASSDFSSQAAAGNRRSVAQTRAGKILNAGEDNETRQDVAISQTETSLKMIAANNVIPATANFFPTALSLRRSSGHSKTTLCPPIW
jgi:ABC-type phosphate/phosphonate transport system substrate-binding protein